MDAGLVGLRYVGGGGFRPGLPAQDMDRGDIAAIAAQSKRAADDIVEEAVGSGLYEAIIIAPFVAETPDLSSMKKDDLVAMADAQGIDSSGTKADIIARLEAGATADVEATDEATE